MPEADARLTVIHCKPFIDPRDLSDMQKYLPAGWTQHVLYTFCLEIPSDTTTPRTKVRHRFIA